MGRALRFACHKTVICDDLGVARQVCYQSGVRVKAVNLDGTIIHKNGSMTGGEGSQHQQQRYCPNPNSSITMDPIDTLVYCGLFYFILQ